MEILDFMFKNVSKEWVRVKEEGDVKIIQIGDMIKVCPGEL